MPAFQGSWSRELKLLTAVQFLTVFPVTKRRETSAEELGASQEYFPLVGLCIGAILAGVNWLLNLILPAPVVDVLVIIVLLLVTGAMHIDGFSDTCDALSSRWSPQEKWRIMSDSHVGAFGVAGAFCLLLLFYVSLGERSGTYKMLSLILTPALGRWSMVYAIFAFPYAKPEGLGRAFKEQTNWRRLIPATSLVVVAAVGLFAVKGLGLSFIGLVLVLAVWLAAAAVALVLRGKFAGLTGDSYGAINEVTQVFVLIFFCAISRWVL